MRPPDLARSCEGSIYVEQRNCVAGHHFLQRLGGCADDGGLQRPVIELQWAVLHVCAAGRDLSFKVCLAGSGFKGGRIAIWGVSAWAAALGMIHVSLVMIQHSLDCMEQSVPNLYLGPAEARHGLSSKAKQSKLTQQRNPQRESSRICIVRYHNSHAPVPNAMCICGSVGAGEGGQPEQYTDATTKLQFHKPDARPCTRTSSLAPYPRSGTKMAAHMHDNALGP